MKSTKASLKRSAACCCRYSRFFCSSGIVVQPAADSIAASSTEPIPKRMIPLFLIASPEEVSEPRHLELRRKI